MLAHESAAARATEGFLADQSTRMILEALNRAVAQPAGLPLFAAKTGPGLFPSTAKARQAAQRCRDDGLIQVAAAPREFATITEKGLNWLLAQSSPRQVLEDFVRVLEEKQAQAADLIAAAKQMSASLDSLRAAVERLGPMMTPANGQIHHVHHASREVSVGPQPPPAPPVSGGAGGGCGPSEMSDQDRLRKSTAILTDIRNHLEQWHEQSHRDCPLPELFRNLFESHSDLTVGQFHDALRSLHEKHQVYLHPWTGPLYDLPEPPFALLIGHEIAYYASIRE